MGKASTSKDSAADRDADEGARLKNIAISKGLLGRSRAAPSQFLDPSAAILKCDGKDIVKKGNRKNKYLFAFPGIVAPVAGGKFGDLTNMNSRNPILYVDFPQGRLKLFGTFVYPKNKYLTMHFSRGTKSILCEDSFESLVVFSEAWWIGKKEDNPDELKLVMPKVSEQIHTNFDFTAGGGRSSDVCVGQVPKSARVPESVLTTPVHENNAVEETETALRHSARHSVRTQKRNLNYTEKSEDEEDDASSSDDGSRDSQPVTDLKPKKVVLNQQDKKPLTSDICAKKQNVKDARDSNAKGIPILVNSEDENKPAAKRKKSSDVRNCKSKCKDLDESANGWKQLKLDFKSTVQEITKKRKPSDSMDISRTDKICRTKTVEVQQKVLGSKSTPKRAATVKPKKAKIEQSDSEDEEDDQDSIDSDNDDDDWVA